MIRVKPIETAGVKAGDTVLLGMPGITMPGDWHTGAVIWARGNDVLVEQYGLGGSRRHMRLCDLSEIRAYSRNGGWQCLSSFKDRAVSAVAEQVAHVRDREVELGRARDAVWTKLAEIGADVRMFCDEDVAEPKAGELCPSCRDVIFQDRRTPRGTCGWCGWDSKIRQQAGFTPATAPDGERGQ